MIRPSSTYRSTTTHPTSIGGESIMSFNAKQKDAESGYHYFSVRYCDSELLTYLAVGIWLCIK